MHESLLLRVVFCVCLYGWEVQANTWIIRAQYGKLYWNHHWPDTFYGCGLT